MEYEQTLKLKGKQKFARNKVKELFIYNTWDKSISVGVVGEKFDIIFPQVQLIFSLCILDIQSMFWEPNCIWFGWNGHNQMKMLAFLFYQGKSTASHKTCLFHLYSKWVVGVGWGSPESIFFGYESGGTIIKIFLVIHNPKPWNVVAGYCACEKRWRLFLGSM
jgi:hypothetical protein